jgi:hypothetical protein
MGHLAFRPSAVDGDNGRDLVRLQPSIARMIGEYYLNSRNTPRDALVMAAYKQLQSETDRLFKSVVGMVDSRAIRIVFTRCQQPYGGDADLIAAVRTHGILEITSAAVLAERVHPVLDCEFGGAFDRFRALHDLIGHAGLGYGFDLPGECAAWLAQDRLHSRLAGWALATELCGVNSAGWCAGEAPQLKAILLEPCVLDQARAMVERDGRLYGDEGANDAWRVISGTPANARLTGHPALAAAASS